MKTILYKTIVLCSVVLLSSCNGGGSENPNPGDVSDGGSDVLTGQFIDAPVKGLNYKTPTQSGVSNDNGEFLYKQGETVKFTAFGYEIGDAVPNDDKKILVSMLDNPLTVARLLQTMDTNSEDDLIDITGVKIPASMDANMKKMIAGDLEFDKFITQENYDLVKAESETPPYQAMPVTSEDAVNHVENSAPALSFTADEVSRSVITSADFVAGDAGDILRFKSDGSFEQFYGKSETSGNYSINNTWSVADGKLITNHDGGVSCTTSKLSETSKMVYTSHTCSDGVAGLMTWHKTRPLSPSDFEGRTYTNTINNVKVTVVWESGGTGIYTAGDYSITFTYKSHPDYNNVILDTSDSYDLEEHYFLIEGTLQSGKVVSFTYQSGILDEVSWFATKDSNWKVNDN